MYIQFYAIPAQIIFGILGQLTFQSSALLFMGYTAIEIVLFTLMYSSSSQLFPYSLIWIIPFQKFLTLMNFDFLSVGLIPYLVFTQMINEDILKRLPKMPIPPPRRSNNPQIDAKHNELIQTIKQQNQKSQRKYEYFQIVCLCLCYALIPKQNYTAQLLNTTFLQYYYKADFNTKGFKIGLSFIKLTLCALNLDIRSIITVALLPNFINDQKTYSYVFLIEQFLVDYFQYHYGIYHNLIIFLSFYIFDCNNSNIKQLTLLYIPLIVYAFETQSTLQSYTYIIICCVYFALLLIEQEKQTIFLRYILVIVGLFITEQWYYKLLIMLFLFDTDLNFNIQPFIQGMGIKQIFDLFITYSPIISSQFYEYKYQLNTFDIKDCFLSIITLLVTFHIHQQHLIFSRVLQIYLLSLPLWPVILYYHRTVNSVLLVITNLIQILLQFQKQQ